jgi:hypothetical protein
MGIIYYHCSMLFLFHQITIKYKITLHLRTWLSGGRNLFSLSVSGFDFFCVCLSFLRCLTCPLSLQGVQWTQRLVVVRVRWSGHPGYKKKSNYLVKFNVVQIQNMIIIYYFQLILFNIP